MTGRRLCAAALLLLLVAGANILAGTDQPDRFPKEIQQAEQSLTRWLTTFQGQTSDEVRKALGPPDKDSHWLLNDMKQPLYKYTVSKTTELSFYFGGEGRVVKVGLHFLP